MIDLDDPFYARALCLEHDLDVDLQNPQKSIVLAQIASAREAAIDAAQALMSADPFKPEVIMRLQNDVRHFRNLIIWFRNAQSLAREIFANLPPEEQEEVRAYTRPQNEIVNDA